MYGHWSCIIILNTLAGSNPFIFIESMLLGDGQCIHECLMQSTISTFCDPGVLPSPTQRVPDVLHQLSVCQIWGSDRSPLRIWWTDYNLLINDTPSTLFSLLHSLSSHRSSICLIRAIGSTSFKSTCPIPSHTSADLSKQRGGSTALVNTAQSPSYSP